MGHRAITPIIINLASDSDSSSSESSEVIEASIIPCTTADGKDELQLKVNDTFQSTHNEYVVVEFLGAGTFGKVIKCRQTCSNEFFAVKVLRANSKFTQEGNREIHLLKELGQDAEAHNIVAYYETFNYLSHRCLVFEIMEMSLRDYIINVNLKTPFQLEQIRVITSQLLTALIKLTSHGIVHTDLKPENIMMVDTKMCPFRVKIIDLGGAFHLTEMRGTPYIGTRFYRAPEVILGLPISASLDVWSVGCIATELFTGSILYPGASNYEMIKLITDAQGFLPGNVLSTAPRADKYFLQCQVDGTSIPSWRLKLREELAEQPKMYNAKQYTRTFWSSLEQLNLPKGVFSNEQEVFVAMLQKTLDLDQGRRITAERCLSHAFMTFVPLDASVPADRDKEPSQLTHKRPANARKSIARPRNLDAAIEGSRKRKIVISSGSAPTKKGRTDGQSGHQAAAACIISS